MPGATASASESARPDDVPSCSFVEHLLEVRGAFLKILDMFDLVFLGIRWPEGGYGVPSHVNRSGPVAAHLIRSSPRPLTLCAVGPPLGTEGLSFWHDKVAPLPLWQSVGRIRVSPK